MDEGAAIRAPSPHGRVHGVSRNDIFNAGPDNKEIL